MTAATLLASARSHAAPPADLTPELRALWYIEKGDWTAAHDIAQDIPTRDGSWLHALLHLVEGDTSNAAYWYAKAGRPPCPPAETHAEWQRLALHLCGS